MDQHGNTVEHLRMVTEIIDQIDTWPAEVGAVEYQYEMFGCWSITVRRKGQRTRFDFDGKEGYLGAKRLVADSGDFTKPPESLGGMELRTGLTRETLPRVIAFVRKHGG